MLHFPLYVAQSRKNVKFSVRHNIFSFGGTACMFRTMIDYLINTKHVARTSERKCMLWLKDNLDFTFHTFVLLPDMQFSNTDNALLCLYCWPSRAIQQYRKRVVAPSWQKSLRQRTKILLFMRTVISVLLWILSIVLVLSNTKFPAVDLFLLKI